MIILPILTASNTFSFLKAWENVLCELRSKRFNGSSQRERMDDLEVDGKSGPGWVRSNKRLFWLRFDGQVRPSQ